MPIRALEKGRERYKSREQWITAQVEKSRKRGGAPPGSLASLRNIWRVHRSHAQS